MSDRILVDERRYRPHRRGEIEVGCRTRDSPLEPRRHGTRARRKFIRHLFHALRSDNPPGGLMPGPRAVGPLHDKAFSEDSSSGHVLSREPDSTSPGTGKGERTAIGKITRGRGGPPAAWLRQEAVAGPPSRAPESINLSVSGTTVPGRLHGTFYIASNGVLRAGKITSAVTFQTGAAAEPMWPNRVGQQAMADSWRRPPA